MREEHVMLGYTLLQVIRVRCYHRHGPRARPARYTCGFCSAMREMGSLIPS